MVGGGLGGGIGTTRAVGSIFSEFCFGIKRKCAENFVGLDMVKSFDLVFGGGVKKNLGSQNISSYKCGWAEN